MKHNECLVSEQSDQKNGPKLVTTNFANVLQVLRTIESLIQAERRLGWVWNQILDKVGAVVAGLAQAR